MGWNNSIFPLLIITSGSGFTGLFVYSPGPGAGNLIASIAAQAGTDPYGNAFKPGVTSYGAGGAFTNAQTGVLELGASLNAPAGPASLNVSGSPGVNAQLNISSGIGTEAAAAGSTIALADSGTGTSGLTVADGRDGNTYATERLTVFSTSNFAGNSTSPLAITGLQVSKVAAGASYRVHGMINIAQGAVTSGQRIAFSGTATVTSMRISGRYADTTALTQGNPIEITALAGTPQAQNMTANDVYDFWFDGIINVNAAGTFGPTIQNLTSGDTCTIGANSFMDLMPV